MQDNINHKYQTFITLTAEKKWLPSADGIFKCNSRNDDAKILNISLYKLDSGDLTNNKSALVQVMVWHLTNNKPLPEPLMTIVLMLLCRQAQCKGKHPDGARREITCRGIRRRRWRIPTPDASK